MQAVEHEVEFEYVSAPREYLQPVADVSTSAENGTSSAAPPAASRAPAGFVSAGASANGTADAAMPEENGSAHAGDPSHC